MTSKYECWKRLTQDEPLYGLSVDDEGPFIESGEQEKENVFRLFLDQDEAISYGNYLTEGEDLDLDVVKMSLTDISKVAFIMNEKCKKSTGLPLRIDVCYVLQTGEPQTLDIIWKPTTLKN